MPSFQLLPGAKAKHNGRDCVVTSVRSTKPSGDLSYSVRYADGTQAGNLPGADVSAGAEVAAAAAPAPAPQPTPAPLGEDDFV